MPPPTPSPERSRLIDLAPRNLCRYFPNLAYVKKLNAKAKAAAVAKVIGGRCQIRACVYPAMANGKCRLHLIDAVAEASTLPSALGFVVTQLHGPQFHAEPSR